jgi:hypothetical protein
MKCPECVRLNLTSRLAVHKAEGKKETVAVFYDEDGKKHVHAPTIRRTIFSCSNKHAYVTMTVEACPQRCCSWNDMPMVRANSAPLGGYQLPTPDEGKPPEG